jgi:cell division septation protein DedD
MANSQDTEITLGTGKMLALFFGLVALCAVFFGTGFSLGRSSVKPLTGEMPATAAATNPATRPSAIKPASAPSNLTFYKAVEQKDSDTPATPTDKESKTAEAPTPVVETKAVPSDPVAPAVTGGYFVQVAAVSKQEDAQALVDALKKKQYPAFTANGSSSDKLFHVQVGPFSDIKDAEGMRTKLVGDGYNPILKK